MSAGKDELSFRWWIGFAFSLGFWVLSVVAPQFIPLAFQAIFGVLACLSLYAGVLGTLWHYRAKLGCVWALALAAIALIPIGWGIYWFADRYSDPSDEQQAPRRDDVTPLIQVDGREEDDLIGNVLIRNLSDRTVVLLAYEYDTLGGHVRAHSIPQSIPALQTKPIELYPGNALFRTAHLDLRYNFRFAGDETTFQNHASFVIPENSRPGDQIGPDECCEGAYTPISERIGQNREAALREPKGHLALTMYDRDGVQQIGAPPHQLIRFNPVTRIALFASGPTDRQLVLTSGLAINPRGEHFINVQWDISAEHYAMSVDGRPAKEFENAQDNE